MYSLKITATLRCFITMLHGKVFTWLHTLLFTTTKEYFHCIMLHLWCHLNLPTLPAQCMKSFFYQKISRLVTCDCPSKSLQAHISPTHSLSQPSLTLHKTPWNLAACFWKSIGEWWENLNHVYTVLPIPAFNG